MELATRTLALPLARHAHKREATCDFGADRQMITQQGRQSDKENMASCAGASTLQA